MLLKRASILIVILIALVHHGTCLASQEEQRFHSSLQTAAPEKPFIVSVGIKVDQIVNIDQRSENFQVVGNLRFEWDHPDLAFEVEDGQPRIRFFALDAFIKYVDEVGIFAPGFLIENQQGRRFVQDSLVSVFSNGHAIYLERFTATLQAPEFDFTRYPFDSQKFFVHLTAAMPLNFVEYESLPGYSRLGEQLGEEEWLIGKSWITVGKTEGITGKQSAHFSFGFEGTRHLNYYFLRIFLPLLIIILVSWFTFFLNDYGKRVDVSVANLLVFVAFNFTISSNIPRLGYLTFIDAIMFTAFVFAGFGVLINVVFRRIEVVYGREALARQLDLYMIWFYPITLALLIVCCWCVFFTDW